MLVSKEKLNSRLLFVISFCITALAIYLSKFTSQGNALTVPHNFIQNIFFVNITFLGSGIFCVGITAYFFYKKKNTIAKLIVWSFLISLLMIQLIKNYLYNNGIKIFFEDEQYLFNTASQKSITAFISAHTAIAFNLAIILSLYFKNKVRTVLLFAVACMVAYSRVYFAHHTLPEIFAGAFAGLVSGAISFYFHLNHIKINKPRVLFQQKFNNPEMR